MSTQQPVYAPMIDELCADIADQLVNRAAFFDLGLFTRTGEFGVATKTGRATAEVGGNRIFITMTHPFDPTVKYEFVAEVKALLTDTGEREPPIVQGRG